MEKKTSDLAGYMKDYFNNRLHNGVCGRCRRPAVIVRYFEGARLLYERKTRLCANHTALLKNKIVLTNGVHL